MANVEDGPPNKGRTPSHNFLLNVFPSRGGYAWTLTVRTARDGRQWDRRIGRGSTPLPHDPVPSDLAAVLRDMAAYLDSLHAPPPRA